jgi:hypothetical protein
MADLKARGFNCRNCGAPVTLRGLSWTQTVTCPSCDAIQDPNDPNLLVLQEAERRQRIKPLIPLGARGTLDGHVFEVIGFQYRTIDVDGETYGWSEYLLFNPYHGFRYLSEYQGHWNLIRTLHALPEMRERGASGHENAFYGDETFRHFQSSTATTAFVMGEFPWEIRAGDRVSFSDYVAPPRLLSAEREVDDTTWSLGTYTPGADIWRAFDLPGSAPDAQGVFANQPSPYAGQPGRIWRLFAAFAALLVLVLLYRAVFAAREPVFNGGYTFYPGSGEASFVTPEFVIARGPNNMAVDIETDVANTWTYFNLALIDTGTGEAFDFGEEVSYYFGRDSDGTWTEGSKRGSVMLPQVPAGRYYLRVEPETDAGLRTPVHYTIRLRRDVPIYWPYLVAFGLLAIPPVLVSIRAMAFEGRRWAESDEGGSSQADDDDDDDVDVDD